METGPSHAIAIWTSIFFRLAILIALLASGTSGTSAQSRGPSFRVIALAEKNSIHRPLVDAARIWLEKEEIADNFSIDYSENTEKIDADFLSRYQLFLQLDCPPYLWTEKAALAFQGYLEEGKGGCIGFEDETHPVVRVLASVEESSYTPDSPVQMGDHLVVWTKQHVKARNVYIFMGHRAEHFQNKAFTTLFHNSILWAAHR